jgi:hypothetical protein
MGMADAHVARTAPRHRPPSFVYFRIYGSDTPAFDGSWQLPDFEPMT